MLRERYRKYKEAVAFVESFSNTSFRNNYGSGKRDPVFFLERTRFFLKLIGNPEAGLKFIHITGTAGKGSVSAMVHDILVSANKKAGLFTSPHVTASIEKIKEGQLYISPEDFVSITAHLKPYIKKAESSAFGAPSSFEIFLAIAFIYFKKRKCEWVVLEVGLGGRYDATNVIKKPKVTAITSIDYDHTEILGKTLPKIAFDKAGIIKKGSLFFTSEQKPSLQKLFKKICGEQGAAFHRIGKQKGYQDYNRKLASAIAESIGIPDENIKKGIEKMKLPCRFEMAEEKPIIILDGAHNRAKIRSTLANIKKLSYEKLAVIIAISDTKKDNTAILKPLATIADTIIVTSLKGGERPSVHPNSLLPELKKYKKRKTRLKVVMNPHDALLLARKNAGNKDCILVTGSFFLAGELRTEWFSEKWVLENRKSF